MKHEGVTRVRSVLVTVTLFVLVPAAHGATLYVANNGVDGPSCGTFQNRCRSITQAVANAHAGGIAGDMIFVGPGRYGDLNSDGILGNAPGEEVPSVGCSCMLSINWPVILLSTDGAAATLIDARTYLADRNVLIAADGVDFGRPDHGFMVMGTSTGLGHGIEIDGTNVKVRGNQVIGHFFPSFPGQILGEFGIEAVTNPSEIVLIEQNQVIGWFAGIVVSDGGKTVSKNQVSVNTGAGIGAGGGGSVAGNVAIANSLGIGLSGTASAIGNAVYGNLFDGISASFNFVTFTGVVRKNNIFGNGLCGLTQYLVTGLDATDNYWGASTGPGPDPADSVCNTGGGTTNTTPFAILPFHINPDFNP